MRIGIDGTALTIPYHCGIRHYAENLIRELGAIQDGREYVLFLPGKAAISIPDRFKIVYLPRIPLLKRQVFLPWKVMVENVDVLHYLEPFGSLFIWRPKLVLTVHDTDLSLTYPWLSRYFLNRLWCEVSMRVLFARAARLICVSNFIRDEVVWRFSGLVDEDNVSVIYNGYSDTLFHSGKSRRSEKYFLAMGDFSARKNGERVLQAFAHVSNFTSTYRLKVVVSNRQFLARFMKLVNRLKIGGKVDFLVAVGDRELGRLYQHAQAFLYPSLYEGFGMPILEAMASGCPVVTSNYGAMKEVAGGAAYLVDPRSVDDLVSAMEKMINEDLRGDLVRKGLVRAKQFSFRENANKLSDAYAEVYA